MCDAQVFAAFDLNLDEIRPVVGLDFACSGVGAMVVGYDVKSTLRHCKDIQLEV
jgi:hypothetical protein